MANYKLRIEKKEYFGFRVTNDSGDAELGNWHVADFAWEDDAKFYVEAYNLYARTKGCSDNDK